MAHPRSEALRSISRRRSRHSRRYGGRRHLSGVEAQRASACCDVAAARRDAAGAATTRDDEAGTAAACDSKASTAATCRDAAAAGCRAPGAAAACSEGASSAACGHAGAATCGQTGELRWATMPEMTAALIKRCFEP